MGRNNTKAVKNIAKMYEQLGLAQDDIFHKTKLLLSIYRDVVWATLSDCNCVNEEIYYYGDDLTDALVYLEEFAPDIERSKFERRVCNLFENKWMIDLIDKAMSKVNRKVCHCHRSQLCADYGTLCACCGALLPVSTSQQSCWRGHRRL